MTTNGILATGLSRTDEIQQLYECIELWKRGGLGGACPISSVATLGLVNGKGCVYTCNGSSKRFEEYQTGCVRKYDRTVHDMITGRDISLALSRQYSVAHPDGEEGSSSQGTSTEEIQE
jgi:hypothetical protein